MTQKIKKILCTGGAGYIGMHTVALLVDRGYEVVVVDNFCNSSQDSVDALCRVIGKAVEFELVNLVNIDDVRKTFRKHSFDAVIHFAALKAVGESCDIPLRYYSNNLVGLLNLVHVMDEFNVHTLLFSGSAVVYAPQQVKLTETSPLDPCNPYGQTKMMSERILHDIYKASINKYYKWQIAVLRYFNPIGAHNSGLIGDCPTKPQNLLPCIQKVAAGSRDCLHVFGKDWDTIDGTGVRDYIHVMDLAECHIASLDRLLDTPQHTPYWDIFNVGSGEGVSVLQLIKMFEEVSGVHITYKVTDRRPGDLPYAVADPSKANEVLGWKAQRSLREGVTSAWVWQKNNRSGFEKE